MQFSDKDKKILFLLIVLFAILLRVVIAPTQGYLVDEESTITWGNNNTSLMQTLEKDFHPPPIYVIGYNIQNLTNSLFETRLFFILFFVLTAVIIYLNKSEDLETRRARSRALARGTRKFLRDPFGVGVIVQLLPFLSPLEVSPLVLVDLERS